jgi:hypothetical protein
MSGPLVRRAGYTSRRRPRGADGRDRKKSSRRLGSALYGIRITEEKREIIKKIGPEVAGRPGFLRNPVQDDVRNEEEEP